MLLIQGNLKKGSEKTQEKLSHSMENGNEERLPDRVSIDQVFCFDLPAQRVAYFRANVLTEECEKGSSFNLRIFFLGENVEDETLIYAEHQTEKKSAVDDTESDLKNVSSVFRKDYTIDDAKAVVEKHFLGSLEGVASSRECYIVLNKEGGVINIGTPNGEFRKHVP